MKIIPISGVIGWDVSPKEIRAALEAAAGEQVEVQISSPGGLALEAFEIYNLIRNYKGPKNARLMGEAASAASYIAMAADKVIGEENVVFMIHNAQGGAMGDHNTMRKAGSILEGLSGILAQAYARKSGKPIEEIQSIMDEQGWYFGQEAMDAGFVDEIVPAPADAQKDKAAAMALARAKVQACRKIIGEVETAETLEQAAAMLPVAKKPVEPAGVAGVATAAKADGTLKTGGAKPMTLEELKRDHPDLYAAVFSAGEASGKVKGVTEGVTQERARVTALEKWIAADAGNEKVAQIVAEAKTTGKSEADVAPQLQVAVRDAVKVEGDPDNPPAVRTQAGNGTVDPEAVRMGAKMGVTAADIAKFGQGGK
jgi:ATP-dependent protease ClpP protease subunit